MITATPAFYITNGISAVVIGGAILAVMAIIERLSS